MDSSALGLGNLASDDILRQANLKIEEGMKVIFGFAIVAVVFWYVKNIRD